MKSMPLAIRLAQAKLVVSWFVPFAAYAADTAVQDVGPGSVGLLTWIFLLIFSSVGWAIVHLDAIAEWFLPTAATLTREAWIVLWKSRLKIIQNYIASVSAGCAFYLLAKSVPGWFGLAVNLPDMVIFVGVVPSAMGGTATWDWIRRKFMGGS